MKCSRILILFKSIRRAQRILYPTRSAPAMDGDMVPQETVRTVFVFFGLYSVISLISILLISVNGFSFETSLSAVMASINNIAPGCTCGAMGNSAPFSNFSKWVLTLNMLIGRLEIFPLVVMCFPSIWRRSRADTNLKHEGIVVAGLFAAKVGFPHGETKSLPRPWDSNGFESHALLRRFPLEMALHFTPKAYPEGFARSSSLRYIGNPSPLWMLGCFALVGENTGGRGECPAATMLQ